ncbi:hypothetical protein QTP88_007066 [Uroleucon formosanum]
MSNHLQVASAAFIVMHELMKIKEKKVRRKRRFWRSKLYIDNENRGANFDTNARGVPLNITEKPTVIGSLCESIRPIQRTFSNARERRLHGRMSERERMLLNTFVRESSMIRPFTVFGTIRGRSGLFSSIHNEYGLNYSVISIQL